MYRSEEEIKQVSDKIYKDLISEISRGKTTFLDFLMKHCEKLKNKMILTTEERLLLKNYKDFFAYTAPELVPMYAKIICDNIANGWVHSSYACL
jgi:hypothetical protein